MKDVEVAKDARVAATEIAKDVHRELGLTKCFIKWIFRIGK